MLSHWSEILDSTRRKPGMLYLNQADILQVGGQSPQLYIEGVKKAFIRHVEGQYVQPLKPYLRREGEQVHVADRIIAMPAYIGGDAPIAGIKWVGSKHDNPQRWGLPRASAIIILNDPETNYPIAILEGSLISGMRTAAVTALAASHLAKNSFHSVTYIGCGPIAKMHIVTMISCFISINRIYVYDTNASIAEKLAFEMSNTFPEIQWVVAKEAKDAVRSGEVIITCTTTDTPYIDYDWFRVGTFISNVSLMDLHKEVFLKASKVIVDDWNQCNREKKIINQLVQEGSFSRRDLYAELGEIVIGNKPGRETEEEIILLNPIGIAIEDIACAQEIYYRAVAKGIGTHLELF